MEMWCAREMASIALHAAVFEPNIDQLYLTLLSESYREGPVFLNVLRFFDMPQTLALTFPKKIGFWVEKEPAKTPWTWTFQLDRTLGHNYLAVAQWAYY
jgi:hypothetical protein